MRILLDTNIFIHREDDHPLDKNLQSLLNNLTQKGTILLYHPKSLEDVERDHDVKRKEIMKSKIRSYAELESPPDPSGDAQFLKGISTEELRNNTVDIWILFSVYRDCVDFLITEDRGIKQLANRFSLINRILTISEGLELFATELPTIKQTKAPSIQYVHAYSIDLSDPFFDDLKADYEEFEDWWKEKVCRKDRKCWVSYFQGEKKIGAFLMDKLEDNEPMTGLPLSPKKKRLKINTLKVADFGHKLGDLLINIAIDEAWKNQVEEMYVTHFTKENDFLIPLLEDSGFKFYAKNNRGEHVYFKPILVTKEMITGIPPLQILQEFYPHFYDGPNVKKYIIPIRPEYHERLFTNLLRQPALSEFDGSYISEGNAVKKAYLCRAQTKTMSPGDILLFYRSQDKSAVQPIGIIEEIYYAQKDPDVVLALIKKRTVYTKEEIENILKEGPLTVILFRYPTHLSEAVSLDKMKELGILKGQPQSIQSLKDEAYNKIKEVGGFDERLAIH